MEGSMAEQAATALHTTGQQEARNRMFRGGAFNLMQHDRDISILRSLPANLVAIKVAVKSEEVEPSFKHYVCFGFSRTNPYISPGTPIHFCRGGGSSSSIVDPDADREVFLAGMIVANGKRENEYAILMSFDSAVRPAEVESLIGEGFNVTEIDAEAEACRCIHRLARQYASIDGSMDPHLRGHAAHTTHGVVRWKKALHVLENTGSDAISREESRGFRRYANALAMVNGQQKSLCQFANPHGQRPNAVADAFLARRRKRIEDAHDTFMAGFVACALNNPVAMRNYMCSWGDFMRLHGGAEIEGASIRQHGLASDDDSDDGNDSPA